MGCRLLAGRSGGAVPGHHVTAASRGRASKAPLQRQGCVRRRRSLCPPSEDASLPAGRRPRPAPASRASSGSSDTSAASENAPRRPRRPTPRETPRVGQFRSNRALKRLRQTFLWPELCLPQPGTPGPVQRGDRGEAPWGHQGPLGGAGGGAGGQRLSGGTRFGARARGFHIQRTSFRGQFPNCSGPQERPRRSLEQVAPRVFGPHGGRVPRWRHEMREAGPAPAASRRGCGPSRAAGPPRAFPKAGPRHRGGLLPAGHGEGSRRPDGAPSETASGSS